MISFYIALIPAIVFWLACLLFVMFGPRHTHDSDLIDRVWEGFMLIWLSIVVVVIPSIWLGIKGMKNNKNFFAVVGMTIALLHALVALPIILSLLSRMGC